MADQATGAAAAGAAAATTTTTSTAATGADASALAAGAAAAATTTTAATGTQATTVAAASDAAATTSTDPNKSALEAGAADPAAAAAQTPEQKAAAEKAASDATAAAIKGYEALKPPEGMKLDTPTWQAIAPILAKAGVKPEDAQALVNAFAQTESARVASENAAYVAAQKTAQSECAQLFKPDDYKAAAKAVQLFEDPGLVQFCMQQLGNHPRFIAVMAKFGRAMADDGTPGTAQGGAATTPSAEQRFAKAAGW